MTSTVRKTRPQTLKMGEHYLRDVAARNGSRDALIPILLVAYAACPAVVIVQTGCGIVERCSRDDIYAWCDGRDK